MINIAVNNFPKMLTTREMVEHLKEKNIKFEKISDRKAERYLKYNNNYYNLTSYKNNFEKYTRGNLTDKFIDLDFAYLIDLSIIDMRTRNLLFKMITDIEHYLKMKVLNTIEKLPDEDGYNIVNKFLEKDYNGDKKVHKSILAKVGNIYYERIFSKYDMDENKKLEDIPIWEFVEIITFGEFIRFYEFYTKEYNLLDEYKDIFIYREIVKLRNAVCHNANILNELNKSNNQHLPDKKAIAFLEDCNIGKQMRNKKLSNSRIRQITYVLCMFNEIVTSDDIKENIREELKDLFFRRIIKHKEYYNNNGLLKSTYLYFSKIIEMYY